MPDIYPDNLTYWCWLELYVLGNTSSLDKACFLEQPFPWSGAHSVLNLLSFPFQRRADSGPDSKEGDDVAAEHPADYLNAVVTQLQSDNGGGGSATVTKRVGRRR